MQNLVPKQDSTNRQTRDKNKLDQRASPQARQTMWGRRKTDRLQNQMMLAGSQTNNVDVKVAINQLKQPQTSPDSITNAYGQTLKTHANWLSPALQVIKEL